MDDVVGYLLMLGAVVLPLYVLIRMLEAAISVIFENQSLIVSSPFL